MSQHTIARIANVLESQFQDSIDMSDFQGHTPDEQRAKFLSRALAALCVKNMANVSAEIAAQSVTDGYQDGGIDAIFFDQKADVLFIATTKWSQSGDKPLDMAATQSFVSGVQDLLAPRFERFNDRVKSKESDVRAALYSERPIRLRLILAHIAAQATPNFVLRPIDDLVQTLNDPVNIADAHYPNQAAVYGLVTSSTRPSKIQLQVGLQDWGQIDRPFLAYYGKLNVSTIADWWRSYGNRLFNENLRLFYSSSAVNDAMRNTLLSNPEYFWYFNNGITIICESVGKSLAGSPGNKFGVFTCDGVSVVNGAQTVGTIGGAEPHPADPQKCPDEDSPAWVQVRIISLEKCPPEFGRLITRAANLQNAVGYREFAAMDPQQHRLAIEFALDKRKYAYKGGETDPKGEEGCGIIEATQALGCAHSVRLAVQIKREIGSIWENTATSPYTDLFNESTTSNQVWRSVLVVRSVEEALQKLRSAESPRADMIAVHLNRVILYLVFQDPEVKRIKFDQASEVKLVTVVKLTTAPVFSAVCAYLEKYHPNEYLASLSKNPSKCEALAAAILRGPGRQPDLFAPGEQSHEIN